MAIASRCETHSTKHTNGPIKGIVGGVSRERRLRRSFAAVTFFVRYLNLFRECGSGGQGLAPVSAEGSKWPLLMKYVDQVWNGLYFATIGIAFLMVSNCVCC